MPKLSTPARLLSPDMISPTLWCVNAQCLYLPTDLAQAYVSAVSDAGLSGLAQVRDQDDPPVGGLSQEQADKHFAQAYDGSAARAQLAVLDPLNELGGVSDAFIRSMSGNSLCIVDAPCGAAAATLAFLGTIAELRRQSVLPRQPLDVLLIGAELSAPARQRAAEMVDRMRDSLSSQAIFIESEFRDWDVTCTLSNSNLVKVMLQKSHATHKILLVIANFNSFLERKGKRKLADPQINELFRYASGHGNNVGIWIEPQMNVATVDGGLLSWLISRCKEAWNGFARVVSIGDRDIGKSSAKFQDPQDSARTNRVHCAVLHLAIERQNG